MDSQGIVFLSLIHSLFPVLLFWVFFFPSQNAVGKISTLCTAQQMSRVWWQGRFALLLSTADRSVQPAPECMCPTACGRKSNRDYWTSTKTWKWEMYVIVTSSASCGIFFCSLNRLHDVFVFFFSLLSLWTTLTPSYPLWLMKRFSLRFHSLSLQPAFPCLCTSCWSHWLCSVCPSVVRT